MASSIGTAPAPVVAPSSAASGAAAAAAPQDPATANAWLLLALRKDLDANADGKLSFQEFSQNRAAGNISAEDQAKLAQIDQAAFDAVDQGDGGVDAAIDFGVLAGNKFLWDQIIQHGNPLPSDFLLASLTASGRIADPYALSPDEQKALTELQKKLCTKGFESLSEGEKAVVQRAATYLLKADDSLGLAGGAAPTPEQLSTGITTLTNRIGYELGLKPVASGVKPENLDHQSLLISSTGSDQSTSFALNSVANQLKVDATGSLGQTDKLGTIYVPYLKQADKEVFDSEEWKQVPGETKVLNAEQEAFVAQWTQAHGPITADNVGQLTAALAEKFKPEAGWSFETKQVADDWVGQRENIPILHDQEQQAYREWNPDGTPKVASPTHRAQALTQELRAKQQAFVDAAKTLNNDKAWAIMDYLEGKGYDWKNDLVGDYGLQQLAGLTPDSPQWDELAKDRPDRAVPYGERQKYIDDAKVAISPEQAGNLSALKALGDNADRYNKEDWKSWLTAQAQVATWAPAASATPTEAQQDFSLAVCALNNPSAWALMDLLEGSDFEMHNDLVGDIGLGKLAQLPPESPKWDQLPADKAVPDKAARQAMIDAAKLIGSPEQTANREALRSMGANPESYNKEDWQAWLDANPMLYDTTHWLKRMGQGAAEIFMPIHVDRAKLSLGKEIGLGIATLGIYPAAYTGTHKPSYSDLQKIVRTQLAALGRDTTALDKSMEDANAEWDQALDDAIRWGPVLSVVLLGIPVVGLAGGAVVRAAATGARLVGSVLGTAGRAVGSAIGGAVGVIDQAVLGGMGNLFTTLGAKVPAAVKAVWDKFVQRADEGAGAQELTPLLDKSINGLDSLAAAGQLPAEAVGLLSRLKEFQTRLIRAMKFEIPAPKPAPQPPEGPAKTATPPPRQPAAAKPQSAASAATSNTEQPGHATAPQKTVASQHSEITAAEPDGAKNPAKPGWVEDVKWSDLAETKGQVTINGESFNVVKTKEGQVLTGKLEQGRSRFKEFDASTGQPTGALFYKDPDGSGWISGGLKGGARGDDGAGTSNAKRPRHETNPKGKTPLPYIPPELYPNIVGHIPAKDLKPVREVSGKFEAAANAEVKKITIAGSDLKAALEKFKNLEKIKLTGPIRPADLALLAGARNLKGLDLSECDGLTDEMLQSLSEMENIKELKSLDILAGDDWGVIAVTDAALAPLLRNCKKLQELSLSGFDMSDAGIAAVGGLKDLTKLSLHQVNDAGLGPLGELRNLEVLTLEVIDGLTRAKLEPLRGLPNLRELNLDNIQSMIEEDALEPLRNFPKLTKLRLSPLDAFGFPETVITDADVENLLSIPKLTSLEIRGANLSDFSWERLLRHLERNGDRSRGPGVKYLMLPASELPDALVKFPNVERIELVGPVTPAQLAVIGRAGQLTHLDLRQCSNLTGGMLESLSQMDSVRNLKQLSLPDLPDQNFFTSEGFQKLLKKLPRPINVQLGRLGWLRLDPNGTLQLLVDGPVTTEQLAAIARAGRLRDLDLLKCSNLTKGMLESLSQMQGLKNLERLWLPDSFELHRFTREGFQKLLAELPKPITVELGGQGQLTMGASGRLGLAVAGPNSTYPLAEIARLVQLSGLDLSRVSNLTGDSLKDIIQMQGLKNLERLILPGQDLFTSQGFQNCLEKLPHPINVKLGDRIRLTLDDSGRRHLTVDGPVTAEQLAAVIGGAGKLTTLDLRKCSNLTKEMLESLSQMPEVKNLKRLGLPDQNLFSLVFQGRS